MSLDAFVVASMSVSRSNGSKKIHVWSGLYVGLWFCERRLIGIPFVTGHIECDWDSILLRDIPY